MLFGLHSVPRFLLLGEAMSENHATHNIILTEMRRNYEIRIKLTLNEIRRIQELAKTGGMSVSGLVRMKLLYEIKPESDELIKAIYEKVYNNTDLRNGVQDAKQSS
jgi:hypothetical protein